MPQHLREAKCCGRELGEAFSSCRIALPVEMLLGMQLPFLGNILVSHFFVHVLTNHYPLVFETSQELPSYLMLELGELH